MDEDDGGRRYKGDMVGDGWGLVEEEDKTKIKSFVCLLISRLQRKEPRSANWVIQSVIEDKELASKKNSHSHEPKKLLFPNGSKTLEASSSEVGGGHGGDGDGHDNVEKLSSRAINASIVLRFDTFAVSKLLTIDHDYWHNSIYYVVLGFLRFESSANIYKGLKATFWPILTIRSFSFVLKEASRLYTVSWVRDIGPDLRPNDSKKDDGIKGKSNGDKSKSTEIEPSTLEDIVIAARGGVETLRPALQRLYMTRASAYRDALKSFIKGYQEGIQQIMEKEEDSSKAQQEGNTDKNST
ncbi:hypothetical protein PVK06_048944 [Gossypium arboreum]|uniref:Uncharacterized protein n=1 Tax=Gossypium arboreum TaxID=29729 RepID=A0ABR0MHB3_GOSAR|nr:hypothetical protein PVK06_048944 [Gossypium arboreum]